MRPINIRPKFVFFSFLFFSEGHSAFRPSRILICLRIANTRGPMYCFNLSVLEMTKTPKAIFPFMDVSRVKLAKFCYNFSTFSQNTIRLKLYRKSFFHSNRFEWASLSLSLALFLGFLKHCIFGLNCHFSYQKSFHIENRNHHVKQFSESISKLKSFSLEWISNRTRSQKCSKFPEFISDGCETSRIVVSNIRKLKWNWFELRFVAYSTKMNKHNKKENKNSAKMEKYWKFIGQKGEWIWSTGSESF